MSIKFQNEDLNETHPNKPYRMMLSFNSKEQRVLVEEAEKFDVPATHLVYSCMKVATELSAFYGNIDDKTHIELKKAMIQGAEKHMKKMELDDEIKKQTYVYMNNFFDYLDQLKKLTSFANRWREVRAIK
ncbi:MAG: hypothetical protein ACK5QX_06595 [bacterium]|jgi:hypothetical protein